MWQFWEFWGTYNLGAIFHLRLPKLETPYTNSIQQDSAAPLFAFCIYHYNLCLLFVAYFEQGVSRVLRHRCLLDSVFYMKILYCVWIPQFACCAIVEKACVDCKIQGSKHNELINLRKNMNLKLPKFRKVFWCNKWIDSLLPCPQSVRTGSPPRSGEHFDSLCKPSSRFWIPFRLGS